MKFSKNVAKQIAIAEVLYGPQAEGCLVNTSFIHDFDDDSPSVKFKTNGEKVDRHEQAEPCPPVPAHEGSS